VINEGTRGPISSAATVEAAPPVRLHLLFALILDINLSLLISLLEDGIIWQVMLWVTYADDINLYPCVRNKSVNQVDAATPLVPL
jgi:hypothetical protein